MQSLTIVAVRSQRMGDGIRTFVAEDLWLLIAIVTFALISVVAVAGFETLTAVIATIGWFLLTPIFLFWGEEIATAVFGEVEESEDDPLNELKRRYAAGEIDEEEFERRLDRLFDVEDAFEDVFADRTDHPTDESETPVEREREIDR